MFKHNNGWKLSTVVITMTAIEVLENRPIVKCGNSAHILVPKRYLGRKAKVIIYLDEKEKKEGENGKISK